MGTLKNSLEYSKKRCTIFDLSVRKGRVLLNDIDRNGHCNNARFLRECGFGRRDLWHVSRGGVPFY
jgi:acyl-CoA thioesterase FadM